LPNEPQGGISRSSLYDPAVALEFFRGAGEPESIAGGTVIFAESEKSRLPLLRRDRMYLLVSGEVKLAAGRKALGSVCPGEIFGELAPIAGGARSATAVAGGDCRVIALDARAFEKALARTPAFALMLMGIMIARLRETIAALAERTRKLDATWKEAVVFEPKALAALVKGLVDDPPVYYERGRTVVQEGQTGTRMYAVVSGRLAVSIAGDLVERIGPGGVFGEAALMDQPTRLASVVAETDCELLPIGRAAFLALVKTNPAFARTLLRAISARLALLTDRLK
jgi:CRP-like cAMP-binding protein